jgi:hypothetical protein
MFARVDGIDYTSEAVEAIRDDLIKIRDEAIEQAAFPVAVTLSWVIAYLAEYGDMLSEPRIVTVIELMRQADRGTVAPSFVGRTE